MQKNDKSTLIAKVTALQKNNKPLMDLLYYPKIRLN